MQKNVASQKLIVFAFDSTTNVQKTGDAANITAYVSKDYGSVTVLGDTSATEMDATNAKGYYLFDLTQGETNADTLLFSAKSSTANIVVVGAPATVFTTPPNFNLESIDGSGVVKAAVQSFATGQGPRIRKNVALANFMFLMTDSTVHAPATGKTVTVTRSIDGAAFAAGTFSAVSEVSSGWYRVDFGAGDLNGDVVAFRAVATGCDDRDVTLITNP